MKIHDITRPLDNTTAPFPGDPPFEMRPLTEYQEEGYRLSGATLSTHTGTHVDAPAHLFPDGRTLDAYPPRRFYLPCQVLAWDQPSPILPEVLQRCDLSRVEAVLFRTPNSALSSSVFSKDYVYLHPDTARALADRKLRLVGMDYASVDSYDDHQLQAHRILLAADCLILENLLLQHVAPGRYTLSCFPLKIMEADGAPCRAILLES